jgi:glutamine synthetase
MTVLNAAVADAFRLLADRLEAKLASGLARDAAVMAVVQEALAEAKPARFEGNGYAAAWVEEAKKRGLPVLQNTPAALPVLRDHQAVAFLVAQGVLSEEELEARFEIGAERYLKALDIEAATLAEIAVQRVLPALESQLAASGAAAQVGSARLRERVARLNAVADALIGGAEALEAVRARLFEGEVSAGLKLAGAELVPALGALRATCDELEGVVNAALWPMPTYREMLFPVH